MPKKEQESRDLSIIPHRPALDPAEVKLGTNLVTADQERNVAARVILPAILFGGEGEIAEGSQKPGVIELGKFLGKSVYLVGRPEDVRAVLESDQTKRWGFQSALETVGSLLTQDGTPDYKEAKRMVGAHLRVPEDASLFAQAFDKQINGAAAEEKPVDLAHFCFEIMMEMVEKTMLGGYQNERIQKVGKYVSSFLVRISDSLLPHFLDSKTPIVKPGALLAKAQGKGKAYQDFQEVGRIIQSEFTAWIQENQHATSEEIEHMGYLGSVLAKVQKGEWKVEKALHELTGFFMAALDTTYNMMQFMLMEFAAQPALLEGLHGFGNERALLEAITLETLRRNPVLPLNFRETKGSITLEDNTVIPADALVMLSIQTANLDPALFPNADQFDVSHFLSSPETSLETLKARKLTVDNVFAFGDPHACIGVGMAKHVLMAFAEQLRSKVKAVAVSEDLDKIRPYQGGVQFPVSESGERIHVSLALK
jgi:cytochrome P450